MPATTSTTDTVLAALEQQPDATTAELAAAAELGRSTVGKALAALEHDGRVRRTPGGYHPNGRRRPDRWTTPPPAVETEADDGDTQPDTSRLRKGQLRALVLEHLRQHADVEHSPTAVAETLGRSTGAVSNALRTARWSPSSAAAQPGSRCATGIADSPTPPARARAANPETDAVHAWMP